MNTESHLTNPLLRLMSTPVKVDYTSLDENTMKILARVDPRLRDVVNKAITYNNNKGTPLRFRIIEGHRGEVEQNNAYNRGKSKVRWPNGYHNPKASQAIDFLPLTWSKKTKKYIFMPKNANRWDHPDDIKSFRRIGDAFARQAKKLKYEYAYGGDWESLKDYPHFQIGKRPGTIKPVAPVKQVTPVALSPKLGPGGLLGATLNKDTGNFGSEVSKET